MSKENFLMNVVMPTVVGLTMFIGATAFQACSVGTGVQQKVTGNPVEHQMSGGVVCYTYDQGLSCLQPR